MQSFDSRAKNLVIDSLSRHDEKFRAADKNLYPKVAHNAPHFSLYLRERALFLLLAPISHF
jgi:hypothetical protein